MFSQGKSDFSLPSFLLHTSRFSPPLSHFSYPPFSVRSVGRKPPPQENLRTAKHFSDGTRKVQDFIFLFSHGPNFTSAEQAEYRLHVPLEAKASRLIQFTITLCFCNARIHTHSGCNRQFIQIFRNLHSPVRKDTQDPGFPPKGGQIFHNFLCVAQRNEPRRETKGKNRRTVSSESCVPL